MALLDKLTVSEIDELNSYILGKTIEKSPGFISGGLPAKRNVLNITDPSNGNPIWIITNAINANQTRGNNTKATVDTFANRFDRVIGDETTDDKTAFESINSNLIQAVATLMANAGSGGGGSNASNIVWNDEVVLTSNYVANTPIPIKTMDITKHSLQIWINGIRIGTSHFTLIDNNNISINEDITVSNGNIEIIIDCLIYSSL